MIAGTTLMLIVAAGCGTGGQEEEPADEAAGTTAGGGGGEGRDLNFAVVVHSDPAGSFWNVVTRGAEDAGEEFGVGVEVTGAEEGSEQAQLIDTALARNPDGMVISMANPDALEAAIGAVREAGIPFITINSGLDRSAEFGALTHVGQSEDVAGEAAGQRLADEGLSSVLCLVHEAGNIGLEQRCGGIAETFGGDVRNVQVNLNNLQEIQATVRSELAGNDQIDGVMALNPSVATAALAGIGESGRDVTLATFDLDSDVLEAVENGDILFAIDQQQYLQGYLPIEFLVLYRENLNTVGGGLPVLTGPGFVTEETAAQVAELVGQGTR